MQKVLVSHDQKALAPAIMVPGVLLPLPQPCLGLQGSSL